MGGAPWVPSETPRKGAFKKDAQMDLSQELVGHFVLDGFRETYTGCDSHK